MCARADGVFMSLWFGFLLIACVHSQSPAKGLNLTFGYCEYPRVPKCYQLQAEDGPVNDDEVSYTSEHARCACACLRARPSYACLRARPSYNCESGTLPCRAREGPAPQGLRGVVENCIITPSRGLLVE